MAEVKWIKIVTDIFDDEKILLIESMPDADSIIVLWFKLLCLAGKQNNSGVLTMSNGIPYTDEMLATIFRRNVALVSLGLRTFEQFDMIEIIEDAITIPKWGKHQSIEKIERNNEYHRQYMREYRKHQKQVLDDGKPCEVNSEHSREPLRDVNVKTPDKSRVDKIRVEGEKNNVLCAEPSSDADPPHRNILLTLPLNDKSEYPVFEEQTQEWAALYPAVDVIQQLRNMRGWLDANPTKRKTKAGVQRFINGWLLREQDKAHSVPPQKQSANIFRDIAEERGIIYDK